MRRRRLRPSPKYTIDNDPHQEHDFVAFELDGQRLFWKVDYVDKRDPGFGAKAPQRRGDNGTRSHPLVRRRVPRLLAPSPAALEAPLLQHSETWQRSPEWSQSGHGRRAKSCRDMFLGAVGRTSCSALDLFYCNY